ncbi:MAG: gamma-glutamyl-phosphate reductase, partial [Actinobacteria bacterium]|nr:gamma-glutamyl-phosphate reductase [Actinomycetota bacterium]
MSEASKEEKEQVLATARAARDAASLLRLLTREQKDKALLAMADALDQRSGEITAANAGDVARAQAAGTSAALVDRLTLTPSRIADIAQALREVASLPDPVGEVIRGYTLPNGLQVRQIRVPLGVVGMIYEARPNVTV